MLNAYPVKQRDEEERHDDHEPVERVPPLRPLVEVDQGLEERDQAEHQGVELDQAPVPSQGLVWKETGAITISQHSIYTFTKYFEAPQNKQN